MPGRPDPPFDYDELYAHHKFIVDPGQVSLRVDVYLTQHLPNTTRSRIKNASLADCIRANDRPVKANYRVKPGDSISVLLPFPPPPDAVPEEMPLHIIYEDEELLIINKPPGLVVHPAHGNYSGTLVNGLLYYFQNLPFLDKEEHRPGLVHRLDKDTSGLLVIAKTEYAMTFLARQFFEHSTERSYLALVWGNVTDDHGTIKGNIGRSEKNRKVFRVHKESGKGKPAVTHYEVMERYRHATLLKIKLETGRTHQIRVHMQLIGHPVFNDAVYGGSKIVSGPDSRKYVAFIHQCFSLCPRQALHAGTLGFVHPSTRKKVIYSVDLPEDFSELIKAWRHIK